MRSLSLGWSKDNLSNSDREEEPHNESNLVHFVVRYLWARVCFIADREPCYHHPSDLNRILIDTWLFGITVEACLVWPQLL